ncbi:hypothetical protein [Streptomyces atratus]|uniref:Uncharacterized protein n=1 Tax=Streptomyces atratus TaxID=1893 RepID=A0A2Z5JP35_STRAR|nr:hypothetical protein [Streptomyces atratus]AXE82132.1 hypothetical protein C5746_40510 [Streptomyces atratus]
MRRSLGILDHRHRVLVALLRSRNTVTLTLMGKILGHDRNTLSYHAMTSRPLLAFAGTDLTPTHPTDASTTHTRSSA